MKYKILFFLFLISICSTSAFAADVTGTIGLGGQYLDVRGDKAKFNEYRDIDSGVTGQLNLDVSLKDYYLSLNGENIGWNYNKNAGLDTQRYTLTGGMYEQFKYSLFYDETLHNITFGAKSAFSGIGSNTLTGDVANLALPLNSFDYGTKRRSYGGGIEGSFKSPFFFDVKVDRSEVKGILPAGDGFAANGFELPVPIKYSTDNLYLATGYQSRNVIFKVDGTLSKFENHNGNWLFFQQPGGAPAQYSLPPDNSYYKIGSSLMVKLPLNSSFVIRGSYAKLEDDMTLTEASPVQRFGGDVNFTSVSAALASNPITPLNLRLFYNYFERNNDSSVLSNYGDVPGEPNPRFDYRKQEAGLDLGYRLPAKTKVDVGYKYQQVSRNRDDNIETRDNIIFGQIKNTFLDWMSAKVRYQHLVRNSDLLPTETPGFVKYDVADKTEDIVKAGFDFQPIENMSLGIEYNFKQNRYEDSIYGVKSDIRHEVYVDATYAVSIVKLNAYYDMELVERIMNANNTGGSGVSWSSKRDDSSYNYGLKADVDIIKNVLSAQVGWRYEKSYGSNDFSNVTPSDPFLQNVSALDDFVRKTITAKFGYHVTKQLLVDFGYMFENLKYDDDAWKNYSIPNAFANGTFLTGAYANPNYQAHVGFLKLGYNF
jgi:MtrB/PioB family decaheme-associated outer membrane protein